MTRQRFRYSSASTVAAIIAAIGGISLGSWAPYLLPVLIVPLAIAFWTWRAGTDADTEGLTVRATIVSRRLPWAAVTGLVIDARGRVNAQLASGKAMTLPAVKRADLRRLVAASGQDLVTGSSETAEPTPTADSTPTAQPTSTAEPSRAADSTHAAAES